MGFNAYVVKDLTCLHFHGMSDVHGGLVLRDKDPYEQGEGEREDEQVDQVAEVQEAEEEGEELVHWKIYEGGRLMLVLSFLRPPL